MWSEAVISNIGTSNMNKQFSFHFPVEKENKYTDEKTYDDCYDPITMIDCGDDFDHSFNLT